MKISLTDCGKRFNRDWIFREFSYEFLPGKRYAITGPNGSGKSTLLQVVGGATVASAGKISYTSGSGKNIDIENAYRSVSIAAPYLELIEEMTLEEFLNFHGEFKPFLPGTDLKQAIALASLSESAGKQIRYFSSGMKQRAKLIQAIFSDVPCILLDEPTTNLDTEGVAFYHRLVSEYAGNRMIIVCSNDPEEYRFCDEVVRISDYK